MPTRQTIHTDKIVILVAPLRVKAPAYSDHDIMVKNLQQLHLLTCTGIYDNQFTHHILEEHAGIGRSYRWNYYGCGWMIADSPCFYVSWTTPTIQEELALGEGEVTRVIRGKWATEFHCGKAIIKCGSCIENILALINWWFSTSTNVPVDVAK